ncbi:MULTISPECIES: glutamate-5-semialdehyde dehydrogenase [Prochlorococcus]|uniref:Gamma-glutamyl phosphate reductase n=1 Tax=Prochlorococcus marinus (strain SARG / CCMP1375 / SS120) TaxID=167539 RepID=PROA_PROMA|nr:MULTISPECIES: glutamate-5-semialdehyde dehydrogenase [Prochlorococcus]Q7VBM1.1 RecName: Full=Gamma-glutamyl phosphate reductase; Short=GPR; AltName: Full=Glutamate-5-semialdehyde dehydrogenase; AltName: Full=Glutamyl-gamma-semialdehyde dehydrogenase; Short=GSA dehydrogenase [Prochlorococcus marinus subsp. marinus str. CCMP1375]AAQ00116.1 Gamma-glutamyl phosphate reductase [Prochlorococcus marinus subsp. marinus str. CCMP1375]KGG13912.1 Gamma-glutamyl phosphate reductase [Prochlorococcus marin
MEKQILVPSPTDELVNRALEVKSASVSLSQCSNDQRQSALILMTEALSLRSSEILKANSDDVHRAEQEGLNQALLSRLKLTEEKLRISIEGIRQVASLSDPIGIRQLHRELNTNLYLQRVTVPLGVIGVIFESRPDAVMQIASLAIRSGNGAILKGGSEASLTNIEIVKAMKEGLSKSDIQPESICLLKTRQESLGLLGLDGIVDLIIPRGSNELVRFIQDNTRIPVLGHADGICHLYIDSAVNLNQALDIAIDSKCQYPAACNAIETLLLHKDIAASFLKLAIPAFEKLGVTLLGDELSQSFGIITKAEESDWSTEYLDLKLSVKVVSSVDEAMLHIRRYGSRHTDAIATTNKEIARRFLRTVDSSGVYHNCSTRFADGFRYGFGAEVGISTQTLPPRGPVGLDGLVTYRYFLEGDGHIAEDFSNGKKTFSHIDL